MIVHERIDNEFEWLPQHANLGTVDTDSITSITRKPIFWLKRQDNALYFINGSSDSLDLVIANAGVRPEGADMAMFAAQNRGYFYDNQGSNEAVKVHEYKGLQDESLTLQVVIHIKSKRHGNLKVTAFANNASIGGAVLLWDSGEIGQDVSVTKIY